MANYCNIILKSPTEEAIGGKKADSFLIQAFEYDKYSIAYF